MARIQGPLHSDGASGTFAGSLTFAAWKGRPYCRERVDPANPKSALQVGVRCMFGWLSKAWADLLSAPDRASWDVEAQPLQISPYDAFIKSNMARWKNSLPFFGLAGDTLAACSLTITTFTTTGDAGFVNIAITPSATGASGFIIYRSDSEITDPTRANAIAVVNADGGNAVSYVDSNLAAGTYHYRVCAFNDTGDAGTVKADQTAVVT
jgi:hypothetical protein